MTGYLKLVLSFYQVETRNGFRPSTRTTFLSFYHFRIPTPNFSALDSQNLNPKYYSRNPES